MKTKPGKETPTSTIPPHFTDEITSDTLAAWAGEAVFQRERDMTAQWEIYLQTLCHTHRRRTRLMEVLDGLSPIEK